MIQLVIVLSSAFEKLPDEARLLHGAAVMAVAPAIFPLCQSRCDVTGDPCRKMIDCSVKYGEHIFIGCPVIVVERHEPVSSGQESDPCPERRLRWKLVGKQACKPPFCLVRGFEPATAACQR